MSRRRFTPVSPLVAGRADLRPLAQAYNALTAATYDSLAKARRKGPDRAARMRAYQELRAEQRRAQERLLAAVGRRRA